MAQKVGKKCRLKTYKQQNRTTGVGTYRIGKTRVTINTMHTIL